MLLACMPVNLPACEAATGEEKVPGRAAEGHTHAVADRAESIKTDADEIVADRVLSASVQSADFGR